MQRILVPCLFSGLLALPTSLSAQQGGPPASDVVVVNEALQVSGTVEVTNEPLAVEVTNAPTSTPPVRWQLVGFTTTKSTGDLNGPFGAVLLCQTEVHPESRMCTQMEVVLTTSVAAALAGGPAWVWPNDEALSDTPSNWSQSCAYWTSSSVSFRATSVTEEGAPGGSGQLCNQSQPIACCALVP